MTVFLVRMYHCTACCAVCNWICAEHNFNITGCDSVFLVECIIVQHAVQSVTGYVLNTISTLSLADAPKHYPWQVLKKKMLGRCSKTLTLAGAPKHYAWQVLQNIILGRCSKTLSLAGAPKHYPWQMLQNIMLGRCLKTHSFPSP